MPNRLPAFLESLRKGVAMVEQFDWHAYIKQTPYEAFVNSADYLKFLSLCEKLQTVLSVYRDDL
jgi:hypothetical protein